VLLRANGFDQAVVETLFPERGPAVYAELSRMPWCTRLSEGSEVLRVHGWVVALLEREAMPRLGPAAVRNYQGRLAACWADSVRSSNRGCPACRGLVGRHALAVLLDDAKSGMC
jgi:hypothetical protein